MQDQAAGAAGETCGQGDLDAMCAESTVALTAGPNPLDAPLLDSSVTYEVAGYASGKRSYLVFEPAASGEYAIYLGGAPVAMQVCEELPTCTSPVPETCMRTVAVYALTAGQRYEIELGAIAANHRVRLRIEPPEDEPRVASR
jgi:hypothetical protein